MQFHVGREIVDWEKFQELSDALVQDIKDHRNARGLEDPEFILAVGKGGVIPATMVWQAFPSAGFYVIHMSAYSEKGEKHEDPLFLTPIPSEMARVIDKDTTLIVDDICDSGDTFEKLHRQLPHADFACLLQRAGCQFEPQHVGGTIDGPKWVVFPWEYIHDTE